MDAAAARGAVGSWSPSLARFAQAVIRARADGPELYKVMKVLQETLVGMRSSISEYSSSLQTLRSVVCKD